MSSAKAKKRTGPKLDIKHGRVEMNHGSGGRAMTRLIEDLFLKYFDNPILNQQNDQAQLPPDPSRLVMATDSHVISPLFFPGGDIGSLAVHGTVNDIAMAGAWPKYLSVSFILEEGLALIDLKAAVASMAEAAHKAGITIVTGDTKVVERNKGDGLFITTTGIGQLPDSIHMDTSRIQPGDKVIVSGDIGDHGIAVLSQREGLGFETQIRSDTAPLHELVSEMIQQVPDIRCLRDPTRGGLATVLNEWAHQRGLSICLEEDKLPIGPTVSGACELLGMDPLYIANEGKLAAICPPDQADRLIDTMRAHQLGRQAAIIGHISDDNESHVVMRTSFGGQRLVDWLNGEPLPRIC